MRRGDYYVCDGCGAQVRQDSTGVREWDWFKGYLHRAYHYCPACRASAEAQSMLTRSRKGLDNAGIHRAAEGRPVE